MKRKYLPAPSNIFLGSVLFILSAAAAIEEQDLIQLTQPVDHAEGPVWDDRTGLLYFVDIHSGSLYSYDLASADLNSVTLPGDLAIAVPSKHDPQVVIVGWNRSIAEIGWDGKNSLRSNRVLTTVGRDKPKSRFNDGKADREGRLWFGTMGYEDANGNLDINDGSLYFITKQNLDHPVAVLTPVNISNGLAWNSANDKFYYIDTPTNQVKAFDYDNRSGAISNPKVVFDVGDHVDIIRGHPDGMTIDEDDNLWIALFGGGAVIKVDPRGHRLLQVVDIPARHTTSVCWGGPHLDTLFVTTSRFQLSKSDRRKEPKAGSVFAVKNLGARGLPAFMADIIE